MTSEEKRQRHKEGHRSRIDAAREAQDKAERRRRITTIGLVAVLVALVVVAVLGAAPQARAEHWTPFAPHGWGSVGRAAAVLMLSFVGWEAISPLIARLRDPGRQLPRIIGAAFGVTVLVYLGLAVVTVGVLGAGAGTGVPLADLLDVALGGTGRYLAAAAAVAIA